MISGGPCQPPPAWDSVTCGGCHTGLPAECPVSDAPQLCVTAAAFRPHMAQHSWNSTRTTILRIALPEGWWVSANYRAGRTSKGVLEYSVFWGGETRACWDWETLSDPAILSALRFTTALLRNLCKQAVVQSGPSAAAFVRHVGSGIKCEPFGQRALEGGVNAGGPQGKEST